MLQTCGNRCRCLVHATSPTAASLHLFFAGSCLILQQVLAMSPSGGRVVLLQRSVEGAHVVLAIRDRIMMVAACRATPVLRISQMIRALVV